MRKLKHISPRCFAHHVKGWGVSRASGRTLSSDLQAGGLPTRPPPPAASKSSLKPALDFWGQPALLFSGGWRHQEAARSRVHVFTNTLPAAVLCQDHAGLSSGTSRSPKAWPQRVQPRGSCGRRNNGGHEACGGAGTRTRPQDREAPFSLWPPHPGGDSRPSAGGSRGHAPSRCVIWETMSTCGWLSDPRLGRATLLCCSSESVGGVPLPACSLQEQASLGWGRASPPPCLPAAVLETQPQGPKQHQLASQGLALASSQPPEAPLDGLPRYVLDLQK